VPQEIAVYPLLTVRENLDVFGRLNAIRGDLLEERVAWALRWTGLAARENDQAATLSGGMKRRLNIACSVLHRPRLVLLDEPAVGVDPQGRRRIWDMLEELRDEGTSLVQSTHELNEIETVCDRMLILDHGSVIADGTVHDLVSQTVGGGATFTLTLGTAPDPVKLGDDYEIRGMTVSGSLLDVAEDLPRILARVRQSGAAIRHMSVDTPGIEAVFTRLTGRELRE
jgi:ABC-2 type transport system ATP-binding protein